MESAATCHDALLSGLEKPDAGGRPIRYRYLRQDDPIATITALLNEAYAPLAAAGMRFVASYQDDEVTRRRMERGHTIVAFDVDLIVGVITLKSAATTGGSPFYDRPDVGSIEQFAVRPSHQRGGIGRTLVDLAECRIREMGLPHVALDTSEHATDLIAMYQRFGYRFVEYAQWPVTNYRSVVLAKTLTMPTGSNGT